MDTFDTISAGVKVPVTGAIEVILCTGDVVSVVGLEGLFEFSECVLTPEAAVGVNKVVVVEVDNCSVIDEAAIVTATEEVMDIVSTLLSVLEEAGVISSCGKVVVGIDA